MKVTKWLFTFVSVIMHHIYLWSNNTADFLSIKLTLTNHKKCDLNYCLGKEENLRGYGKPPVAEFHKGKQHRGCGVKESSKRHDLACKTLAFLKIRTRCQ